MCCIDRKQQTQIVSYSVFALFIFRTIIRKQQTRIVWYSVFALFIIFTFDPFYM